MQLLTAVLRSHDLVDELFGPTRNCYNTEFHCTLSTIQ